MSNECFSLSTSKLAILSSIKLHKTVIPLSIQSLNRVSNLFGVNSESYAHHLRGTISSVSLYSVIIDFHTVKVQFTHGMGYQ